MARPRGATRRATIVLALALLVPAFAPRATAEDLGELKERARALAAEVTGLERRLRGLELRGARLGRRLAAADQEIGTLELEIDAAEDAYEDALDGFVERAVEAYKSGGDTARLGMMLSARDVNDLVTLSQAHERIAEIDAATLDRLSTARSTASRLQDEIAARRSGWIRAKAEADAVAAGIRTTVDERGAVLTALGAEIDKLEARIARRARAAAASTTDAAAAAGAAPSPRTSRSLLERLKGTGPATGVPKGFTSTGIAFEGLASWYGPGFEGNPTATGDIFDSSLYTAASKELPLNSYLYITRGDRGVVVLVNDRGPYVEPRIIDLSRGSAGALDMISAGVGWVRAEIIVPN